MKYNIFVLCGGKSVEHEISLKSATAIINSIDRDKFTVYPVYIDRKGVWNLGPVCQDKIENPEELALESDMGIHESLARFMESLDRLDNKIIFPALHGQNGEDGTIQGFLEILNIPYVGCGVLASALAMDKAASRDIFKKYGLPQADYLAFENFQWETARAEVLEGIARIGYPVYVKPANSGSSVGISRVEDENSIIEAVDLALRFDNKVIVEEELVAREMQVSVIGNQEPRVSLPGEFIMEDSFFDYDAKYIDNKIIPVVPAKLTDDTMARVRQLAIDSYKVLGCRGLTRVDIFVDGDNNIFVNEANTMPGFTPVSMTPVLWEATEGTSYRELVETLIQYGIEEFEERQKIANMR